MSMRREIDELKRAVLVSTAAPRDISFQPVAAPRSNALQLNYREITKTIPQFNGHNIPVLQFTGACKRILNIVPTVPTLETEQALVHMIRTKLDGHMHIL